MPQGAQGVNNNAVNNYNGPFKSKVYTAATAGNQAYLGAGAFRGLGVNIAGAGSVITLYDGTTTGGKLLGSWSGAALLNPNAWNLEFLVGLFVVVTTTAPTVTIFWTQK